MKRLVKTWLRTVWRWGAPIRRPLMSKFEATVIRCCKAARPVDVNEEVVLLMDHLARELARLQTQVEMLRDAVEDRIPADNSLSVVDDTGIERGVARTAG